MPLPAPERREITRTSRDPEVMRDRLQAWLGQQVAGPVEITAYASTSENGMSSDTVLFTARMSGRTRDLVARIAPAPDDVPVFPRYDMAQQFETIRLVGELSTVPVPQVLFSCETNAAPLGAPFFIMTRVDGVVAPDNLPYTFGANWFFDAAPQDRRKLQDHLVDCLARLHALEPGRFAFLAPPDDGDSALRRHVAQRRAWYDWAVAGSGLSSPLVERAFDWLQANWPAETEARLSWGDSRIGNCLVRDFAPVAVLDWEMAGLGPRELDLGWLLYCHQMFQDFAEMMSLPGLPDVLRREDVCAAYEKASGHTPVDLDWYITYAAVALGIVFLRTGQRAVHFGEQPAPADGDSLIMNRDALERLLAGTYRDEG